MGMHKAVFLDRDGVLNKELDDYAWKVENFHILPDVVPALKKLQSKGYKLIVITNQGGITKGIYRFEDVETVHQYLRGELAKAGIHFEEIYYCPHHTLAGSCICRKPDSLMVEKAIARFHIDPAQSYFIGDKDRDIIAGKKAGVKGILIEQNSSLLEAIKEIK
jgi:D-glycero-D-manno-heptose 1,7-bisphosphate phosphatase